MTPSPVFQAMAVGCLPSHTGPESLGMTVCLRPYWLPEHKRQITHRAERVTQCTVHSSCGRKKNESIGFCIDYHKVNEVSQFDLYPEVVLTPDV